MSIPGSSSMAEGDGDRPRWPWEVPADPEPAAGATTGDDGTPEPPSGPIEGDAEPDVTAATAGADPAVAAPRADNEPEGTRAAAATEVPAEVATEDAAEDSAETGDPDPGPEPEPEPEPDTATAETAAPAEEPVRAPLWGQGWERSDTAVPEPESAAPASEAPEPESAAPASEAPEPESAAPASEAGEPAAEPAVEPAPPVEVAVEETRPPWSWDPVAEPEPEPVTEPEAVTEPTAVAEPEPEPDVVDVGDGFAAPVRSARPWPLLPDPVGPLPSVEPLPAPPVEAVTDFGDEVVVDEAETPVPTDWPLGDGVEPEPAPPTVVERPAAAGAAPAVDDGPPTETWDWTAEPDVVIDEPDEVPAVLTDWYDARRDVPPPPLLAPTPPAASMPVQAVEPLIPAGVAGREERHDDDISVERPGRLRDSDARPVLSGVKLVLLVATLGISVAGLLAATAFLAAMALERAVA